ncbi:MAG: hypothetical protein E6R07_08865 [Nevskiaceae bacterium]|nr:MAG: hypothetical protein E6R07_08865 [Nevskiaceae bacterium]
MPDTASLLWGVLFGSIGLGYFIYGRKQQKPVPLVCGLLLMGYTFFVSDPWLTVAIGGALSALPVFIRL